MMMADPDTTPHPVGAVLWDVAAAAPDLLAAMPALANAIAPLRAAVPVAHSISPFDGVGAVRPYRHLRAFYLRRPDGVIAVKGSEIMAGDVDTHLRMLGSYRIEFPGRGRSLFSALEHFPLNEQKVPLALPVEEALEDVHAAAAVQQAHLARFGTLARVPLPLLALRWPDAVMDAYLRRLSPLLSGRARRTVERVAADGLGCVIYHYPAVPLRVAHLPELLAGRPGNGWQARLSGLTGVEAALEGWLDLLARLLVLGFLPGSVESIGVGHCLEMKNAVIDGGLVDMGSICRVETVAEDRIFLETLMVALADLAKTCRQFLLGDSPDVEAEYRNPSLVMVLLLHRLLPDLAARVEGLGGADPRILAVLRARPAAPALPGELARLAGLGTLATGGHR
ncbi:hypothetical protein [Niveispirillum irakense]|uniref:hypothetical protein n=1 Tax=Niveispirillum irakense TaxID=34011 RepID=UPI001AEBF1D6|nr:hypothetical protein [Niveispirillum irakense]